MNSLRFIYILACINNNIFYCIILIVLHTSVLSEHKSETVILLIIYIGKYFIFILIYFYNYSFMLLNIPI